MTWVPHTHRRAHSLAAARHLQKQNSGRGPTAKTAKTRGRPAAYDEAAGPKGAPRHARSRTEVGFGLTTLLAARFRARRASNRAESGPPSNLDTYV